MSVENLSLHRPVHPEQAAAAVLKALSLAVTLADQADLPISIINALLDVFVLVQDAVHQRERDART